jgi:N,N-dimethylformamidase
LRWETDFVFDIPDGMASGVYGIRLRCDDIEDIVPLYVLPRPGRATASIVFLASTFTYQIYGKPIGPIYQKKPVCGDAIVGTEHG